MTVILPGVVTLILLLEYIGWVREDIYNILYIGKSSCFDIELGCNAGMKCFLCGSAQSLVVDKREVKSTGDIRRRRECLKCHNRFTTYEKICALELFVVKRDGRRELFAREKLASGIERALEKRPELENLSDIVDRVMNKIKLKKSKEVDSSYIGQLVLDELKKLDEVAYLRFASVYRHFSQLGDFRKELEQLV